MQQVTAIVENRPGRLVKILQVLAEHQIDLNGISIAESADFGVFRMILSNPEQGQAVLKEQGFIVKVTQVLAIDVHDVPGGLLEALQVLNRQQINVQYMYAFGSKAKSHAMIILKTDENQSAAALLQSAGIEVLSEEEVEKRLSV